jgi:cytochrome d ubiquinol oxidase subunit I
MQTPAGFHLARRMKETADGALHPLTADLGDAAARIVEVPLPVGHIVRPEELGQVRAVIDDFSAAILNPSTLERLAHTVLACWVVGAFLVAGVAAWWLLRGRFVAEAKASMRIALSVALVACLLQMLAGDVTARGVAERQPTKLAALEGLERSGSDAPLSIVGWVTWRRDDAGRIEGIETTSLRIPGLLSILVSGKYLDPAAGRATVVRGLADLPDDALLRARHPGLSDAELAAIRSDYWPAVPIVFQTYHLMIALGVGLSLLAIVATVLRWRGSLWRTDCRPVRAVLWCLVAAPIAAHVATQAGWFTAEMGRQPWIVYEVLKTGDAASAAVRPRQVATSIVVFTAIYALLTVLFVTIFVSKVRHGPAPSPGAADGESGPLSLRSSRSTAPEAPAATRAAPPAARPEDTPWT